MQSALKSVIGPKKHIHDLAGQVVLVTGGVITRAPFSTNARETSYLYTLLLVPIAQREYDTNFGEPLVQYAIRFEIRDRS
jgi:hypothetical protein